MKKRNFICRFALLACICFASCGNPIHENPILEQWWQEKETEYEYIPIVTKIPEEIYEIICQELSSEEILGNINIICSEPVFFWDGVIYNGGIPRDEFDQVYWNAQKINNNLAILKMVNALSDHPELLMIIHTYYYPSSPYYEDSDYQNQKIFARAEAVKEELKRVGDGFQIDTSNWDDRILIRAFDSRMEDWLDDLYYLHYTGNHRVEMILVEVGK
jgi:hypothetical protein